MSLQHPLPAKQDLHMTPASAWPLAGRISLFILHFSFCLGLLWFHATFTPDIYNVVLNSDNNRSLEEVSFGILLALAPLLWVPRRLELPSEVFAYLLYLAAYLPFCTVGLQSIAAPLASLFPYILVCAMALIGLFQLARLRPSPIEREGQPLDQVYWGAVVAALGVIGMAMATIGVDFFQPLALEDIYDLRLIRREQFGSGNPVLVLLGYLISPLNLVLGPLIVRAGLNSRRYPLLLFGAAITYASYQVSGQKDALGACFIVTFAGIAWAGTGGGRFGLAPWRVVTTFLVFLLLSPVVDAALDDQGMLVSQLTLMRLFIVPGMLGSYWVEFFTDNPHGWYAGGGVLGLLFGREEIYGIGLARVIGLIYGGNEETNANVNMFAEGYAQAGLLGVGVASAVAMLALRLLDRVAVDRDPRVLLPLCVPLAFALTNGHIFGLILSNGLWVLMLLAYVLPRQQSPPRQPLD